MLMQYYAESENKNTRIGEEDYGNKATNQHICETGLTQAESKSFMVGRCPAVARLQFCTKQS